MLLTGDISSDESLRSEVGEEITKWLNDAITMASVALEKIFDFALKTQTDVTLLLSIRARTGDVRRRLTDSTPEHQLNVRLAEWLKRYDRWVASKPKPGESDPEFAARHERERGLLEDDWKVFSTNAVGALQEIKFLGDELQSIDSNAMSSIEWTSYSHILGDEQMVIEAINAEMPTEPGVIAGLRGTATQLEHVVSEIDKKSVELDSLIKKYGG